MVNPIPQAGGRDYYPLSHAQRRLWFLSELEGARAAYNLPSAFRLKGKLDVAALRAALQALVDRHAILRSTFIPVNGEPMQWVADGVGVALPVSRVEAADDGARDGALQHLLARDALAGKAAVVCRDRAGFIVNRLLFPYLNDAVRMVEEGYANAADIDDSMTLGCNHPIGPLALIDLVGLDVTVQILRSLHDEFLEPAFAPRPLLEHMVRAGYLGRKAGRGLTVGA